MKTVTRTVTSTPVVWLVPRLLQTMKPMPLKFTEDLQATFSCKALLIHTGTDCEQPLKSLRERGFPLEARIPNNQFNLVGRGS